MPTTINFTPNQLRILWNHLEGSIAKAIEKDEYELAKELQEVLGLVLEAAGWQKSNQKETPP